MEGNMGAVASTLVRIKQRNQSNLSPEQRTFSQLQKKIETLQKKEKVLVRDLDRALQFYHENIRPVEGTLADLLTERVRIVYRFYKQKMKISRSEKDALKELISDDINEIMQMVFLADVPEDVKKIFKDLNGFDYGDIATEEFGEMKSELQEVFKEQGIDIDLSEINVNDREEEMMQKLFQSFGAAMEEKMDSPSSEKKTQKQRKSEARQSEIEEMQKKSLNSIFRQLAKALHPDLESDSEKKSEKEELMKQVTVAYEEKDLQTLLALELIWINGLNNAARTRSSDQLKIYNGILKDQVELLQARIRFLWDSPKYYPLHRFYRDSFQGTWILHRAHREFCKEEKRFGQLVKQLHTPAAESLIRQAIKEKKAAQIADAALDEAFFSGLINK
jgi:hypothetical protein